MCVSTYLFHSHFICDTILYFVQILLMVESQDIFVQKKDSHFRRNYCCKSFFHFKFYVSTRQVTGSMASGGWWDGGGGRLAVIMIHFPADLFYSSVRQGEKLS